jgi:putative redox protein
MEMDIFFPGDKQVSTTFKGATITVGTPAGGDEPGLEPLDLFFAALGLCVGRYIVEFCSARQIPYENIKVLLRTQWDEVKKMHTKVMIQINLPSGFPEKYKGAILRLVDSCSVKKHIMNPPVFESSAAIGA